MQCAGASRDEFENSLIASKGLKVGGASAEWVNTNIGIRESGQTRGSAPTKTRHLRTKTEKPCRGASLCAPCRRTFSLQFV
jgi:hypothetical protein